MEAPAVTDEHAQAGPVEAILRSWLADPDLTLFCGHWGQGSMMELMPAGRARLSGPRYEGAFAGLRELRMDDGPHHVHLDLGRLTQACYLLTPSVCYGFRPSFELRLTAKGDNPLESFGLGLSLNHPYAGGQLRQEPVRRYFARVADHLHHYPSAVSFACMPGAAPTGMSGIWESIQAELAHVALPAHLSLNPLRNLLQREAAAACP